eukprot:CAMPEP_0201685584 /NCGR_PEP_ID=MMETSP0578-20130828/302_1 /ASSEMBLY_ACC=CAM_ASM_000663 /TAXON_ID=267565 /ORGANISM="Skeletonema grethea, Strain CCMP 1804" /LENGTH=256 /DNA_ID=CAMNT_0048169515 /DNA_START=248 /DNA_END=1015 /DNA_ORIENTATION=+
MAAEGGDIVRFTYTGAEGEEIPDDATHVFVDVTIILEGAFEYHQNIVEVICHDKVERIERGAFNRCPSLMRVIMRGVKIAERWAFNGCEALMDVECGKLEIIGEEAFARCKSLRIMNLPSARIVKWDAFARCEAVTDVKFGNKLERFGESAFFVCKSLERITIPLKDGMITDDDIFTRCNNLKHVDLVEGEELRETIAALHMEEWRKDINEEINSINQNLPNAPEGDLYNDAGGKALVIRRWIRSVLRKIIHYQAE